MFHHTFTRCLALIAIVAASFAPAAGAAEPLTLHVATTGDDANPGSANAPLATIDAARLAVRRHIAAGLDRDVLVLVAPGTYRVEKPIRFDAADAAPAGRTITYAAAPGNPDASAVISGGRAITGWRDAGNGTWTAVIPAARDGRWSFRELFVNGQRRPRAAFPDDGWLRVAQAGPDKRTSFTFTAGDIPSHADAADLELLFLHDWSTSRVRVASIDRDSSTLTVANPIGPGANHYRIDHFEPHPRYRLENDVDFVTQPGEWHLDTTTGVVTYKPMPGETIDAVDAVAPYATSLLEVRGEPGNPGGPVRGLRFRGLAFEHCAWAIPPGGYAAGQAGFHEQRYDPPHGQGGILRDLIPAAVTVELAEDCRFEHIRVAHVGGSGIEIGSRSRDCAITRSTITDIAGNGVLIGENTNRTVDGKRWWQAAPDETATGLVVADSVIEHCGRLYHGCVGIWIGITRQTRIEHNEVRHHPYTGVSMGWMWSTTPTPARDNTIAFNHIHHVMQILSDGGGIYTLGLQPGSVLRGNHIHHVPLNLGRAESNGMFLDEGTTGFTIEHNLIHDTVRSPLRFHRATTNLVKENTLVLPEGVPPIRYNATDAQNIEQVDNTLVPAADFDPARHETLTRQAGVRSPRSPAGHE